MIKTLSPYSSAGTTSKTAEILSRYRPIAPKPEIPASDGPSSPSHSSSPSSSMPLKIRQSPYLRNLWPQLQAKPTRTRKRGRSAISPAALKRQRTHSAALEIHPIPPPPTTATCKSLSFQAFTGLGLTHQLLPAFNTGVETPPTTSPRSLVTLPLLPSPTSVPVTSEDSVTVPELGCILPCREDLVIDLNLNTRPIAEIPEEKDLLRQLQWPGNTGTVIAPQPLRPVGSSISVGSISKSPVPTNEMRVPRKPEEVEEEVETEELPAVISDSNNKVRLVNSAYKEMVGQPECSWLYSMVGSGGSPSCRRISGDVMLRFSHGEEVPVSSDAFSCWVKIDWGSEPKKSSVKAYCEVNKLCCESKDYLYTWRFHTRCNPAPQEVSTLPLPRELRH